MQFLGPEQGRDSNYVPSLQISSYEAERLLPVSQIPPLENELVPHGPSAPEIMEYALSLDRPSIVLRRLHTRILLSAHMRYLLDGERPERQQELANMLNDALVAPVLEPFIENQKKHSLPTGEVQEAQAVIRGIQRVAAKPDLLLRHRVFSN